MEQTETKSHDGGLLKATATALGSAAGSLAAAVMSVGGGTSEKKASPAAPKASGRIAKKQKSRLPRKQKKAFAKRALAA